jgi:hypothetical protein
MAVNRLELIDCLTELVKRVDEVDFDRNNGLKEPMLREAKALLARVWPFDRRPPSWPGLKVMSWGDGWSISWAGVGGVSIVTFLSWWPKVIESMD